MKNSTTLILLSISVSLLPAIAEPDLSKLPMASTKTGLIYGKDIRPIFESSCFRCHGEERHKGGLRLDSLEAALKGGEDGKVIVPGNSKESPLVLAVARLDEKTAMPPKQGGRGPGGPGNRRGGPGGNGPGGGPGDRAVGGPGGAGVAPAGGAANAQSREGGSSQRPRCPSRSQRTKSD